MSLGRRKEEQLTEGKVIIKEWEEQGKRPRRANPMAVRLMK